MSIFEKLIDVNEAAERYNMTPQAIKKNIGGKIIEGTDCKKFGNSWVFLKSSLDIIFRDRLRREERKMLEDESQDLYQIGENFMNKYKKKFGMEKAKEVVLEMNECLHNREKNHFIHIFLEKCLDCNRVDLSDLNYSKLDEYYPDSFYCILFGMNNELNRKEKE